MRSNKEIVKEFYEKVFNGWDVSAVDEYMRDDYKQHSPGVAQGKKGFMGFITEFVKKKPHPSYFMPFRPHRGMFLVYG